MAWVNIDHPAQPQEFTRNTQVQAMTGFKNLIFRTYEADALSEQVSRIFLIKVYHQYHRRNAWRNSFGARGLVGLTFKLIDLDLEEATNSAEAQRTQGSRFVIDEAPAICAIGSRHALIATELFTDDPLSHCNISKIKAPFALRDIASLVKVNEGRWRICDVYTGKVELLSSIGKKETFYSRTSYSVGSKNKLAWSLERRKIKCNKLLRFISDIEAG